MAESTLVAAMQRAATALGVLVEKQHGSVFAARGKPDLYLWVPVSYQAYAVPVVVEVKVPGKKPSALQRYRLAQFRTKGVVAVWVTSVAQLLTILRSIQEGTWDAHNRSPANRTTDDPRALAD